MFIVFFVLSANQERIKTTRDLAWVIFPALSTSCKLLPRVLIDLLYY